jgi:hypothetical protein
MGDVNNIHKNDAARATFLGAIYVLLILDLVLLLVTHSYMYVALLSVM